MTFIGMESGVGCCIVTPTRGKGTKKERQKIYFQKSGCEIFGQVTK